jgi:hypothetical protein
MLRKLIVPLALGAVIAGPLALPSLAQERDRNGYYDRDGVFHYYDSGDRRDNSAGYYDRDGRFHAYDRSDRSTNRWDFRANSNDPHRQRLMDRMDQIRREARRLHERGLLSRGHMAQTIDKLGEVERSVNGRRMTDDRFNNRMQRLNEISNTMHEWMNSDHGR